MSELANKVKDRLISFIEYKELSVSAFEKACGLSNGYIRNFKGNLGGAKLEGILNAFPELDKDWLLFGEKEMLYNKVTPQNPSADQKENNGMIGTLLTLVESQRKDLETLIQIVKDKDEKIDELLGRLEAREKETAQDAGHSSSVIAG